MSFLIDTNHVNLFFDKDAQPTLTRKLESLPAQELVWFSAVTLGEIEAGHRRNQPTDPQRRDDYNRWLKTWLHLRVLEVGISTATYYGNIMGAIWTIAPPPSASPGTERHLLNLGVDVNDVWMVAVAWEHNLTFVTSDSMDVIRSAVPQVKFDSWL